MCWKIFSILNHFLKNLKKKLFLAYVRSNEEKLIDHNLAQGPQIAALKLP